MARTAYNKMSENKKDLPDSVELAKQEEAPKAKKAKEPKVKLIRVIIINGLNIRKGPGKEYEAIDILKYGSVATVLEFKKDTNGEEWARLANGKGWIMFRPNYAVLVPLT